MGVFILKVALLYGANIASLNCFNIIYWCVSKAKLLLYYAAENILHSIVVNDKQKASPVVWYLRNNMASSGDGELVQYLYTPDLEDELYQQNLMLTHPTNILKLDDINRSTAAGGSRYDGEIDDQQEYFAQNSGDEPDGEDIESIEVSESNAAEHY